MSRERLPKPPKVKNKYIVPTLAYDSESFRLGPVLGERAGGSKRPGFTGVSVFIKGRES